MLLESSPYPFKPVDIETPTLGESEIQISDTKSSKYLMKVRGIFQRYDEYNDNGRMYEKALWDRCLNEESWVKSLSSNSVIGIIEHPENGITTLRDPLSHIVTKAWDNNDGTIWGEAIILDNPDGQKIASILKAGGTIGISSRGEGEVEVVKGKKQHRVIPESFSLRTWDFVFDNSVHGARVSPFKEESIEQKKTEPTPVKEILEVTGNVSVVAPHSTKTTETVPVSEAAPKPNPGEYLPTSPSRIYMSKLAEMRKLDFELHKAKQIDLKKLTFQARVGVTEGIMELQAKIADLIIEDASVKGYGEKLLKEADEFNDEVEAPPVSDEAPPSEEAPPAAEEAPPSVDKESFDKVMQAVVASLKPPVDPEGGEGGEFGAPPAEGGDDCQAKIDSAYEQFVQDGTIDVQSIISDDEEGADDFGDDGDDYGGEGDDVIPDDNEEIGDETTFESRRKELNSAYRLINRLRESGKKGETFRKLLDEAGKRVEVLANADKKLAEARKRIAAFESGAASPGAVDRRKDDLIAKASAEIENYSKDLAQEKLMNEACIELLRKNGVDDCDKLIAESLEAKAKANGKAEGKKPTAKLVTKDENSKEKIEEAKTEPAVPHSLIRLVRRQRTNAFRQL